MEQPLLPLPQKHTDLWDGTLDNVKSVGININKHTNKSGEPYYSVCLCAFQRHLPILFNLKTPVKREDIADTVKELQEVLKNSLLGQIDAYISKPSDIEL